MDARSAQSKILQDLVSLGRAGGMVNAVSAIRDHTTDYQKAFDIANDMQNKDWIKVIYCSADANLINVELTLKGKDELSRRQ